MSNFGANFRKARETAGLPLEKIAAETRITTRFLTAIENEEFELLPGGIFNRGFIRAYAEYLGIDSDQAVADYDRMSSATQQPVDVLDDADRAPSRSEWNLYPVAAAVLLVLMAAYYFVTRKPATTEPAPPRAAATTPQEAPPDAPANLSVAVAADKIPSQRQETTTVQPPPVTPAATPVPVSASAPAAASTPPPAPAAARPATPPPSGETSLAVNLNVIDSTWVKVTTDGTLSLSALLEAGEIRRFSANQSIDVVIGNAAGATMQINGRDLGSLGMNGRVREFRITPENAARIR